MKRGLLVACLANAITYAMATSWIQAKGGTGVVAELGISWPGDGDE